MITPDWKQVGADQWDYVLEPAPPLAHVRWIPRADRESKNFRFEATVTDKYWGFRTIAGAKRFVENYFIQKGKLDADIKRIDSV
jgi:hypothetical protein